MIIPAETKEILFIDHLSDQTIVLEKNANLTYVLAPKEGNLETVKIRFELKGEGAHLQVLGVLFGKNEDKFLFETAVVHSGNNTFGHVDMKGIMLDQARTEYLGMICIPKNTVGADGYLAHHTLLMSKKASTKSVPSLEIEANDLKAGHSASVGQIDDEALFYMQSRGLDRQTAKTILTESFLEEIIRKIPNEEMQQNIRAHISHAQV